MSVEKKHVICRACHAQCGLIVDFENGQPVATHGNKDNPAFRGYSCLKGRELFRYHSSPSRLLSSLKKTSDGSHVPVHWRDVAKESADKLKSIIEKHGPSSVAMFVGTFGYNDLASQAFANAFLASIGSHMSFTAVTIDQPGKIVSSGEHGSWLAGQQRISQWDGLMMIGTNPVISQNGGLSVNPAGNLHRARKRGMELIVMDPRRTESAAKADLHLQTRPGEDTAVLAAITRLILKNDCYDHDFVRDETQGIEALERAVEPYTTEVAAMRSGVEVEDIEKAARMIGNWNRGHLCAGTGPNMSGFGNIVEYLCLSLSSLKGFWMRPGDVRRNEGVFIHQPPPIAAASGPFPSHGLEHRMRTRNLAQTAAGMPTAALAEEILTPGDGQVKALIVLGGNPVLAWPDQTKTVAAMKELDLLVCLDPRMSKTCDFADYVIAPTLHYEKPGVSGLCEMLGVFGAGWGFDETYGQVCHPILDVPEGSDLCDEHEFFIEMAREMNLDLEVASFALAADPEQQALKLTKIFPGDKVDAIGAWSAALNAAPMSVEDAFADPEMHVGKLMNTTGVEIQPKPEGWEAKLVIGAPKMMSEIQRYEDQRLTEQHDDASPYPFRLISRRLNDIHNSNWHEISSLRKRLPHHPAYINPDDLLKLGLKEGDVVEISSEVSAIKCVAYAEQDVRAGCVSVPHSWGTTPDEEDDPRGAGGNTGRLTDNGTNYDPLTGIPIMSAIPVQLQPA